MLPGTSIQQWCDRDLLRETERAADEERRCTASLLTLLGEVDRRRLYLGESCSSLFTYCTQVLHFSEHAAYHRIEAARAARQFPVILEMIAEGALTLTSVALLRPHLTRENHKLLLDSARYKSKREVEHQVACLSPRADEPAIVRKFPAPTPTPLMLLVEADDKRVDTVATPRRPIVAPLASDRYLLKISVSAATHARLRRAQDLMRHTIANGDPAVIIDQALALLVEQLERTKFARSTRPRECTDRGSARSRRVPRAIKRQVWGRDEGRCAFIGTNGRCVETGFLEFHHIRPFADGGQTTAENLQLRCRAHNQHEAALYFGPELSRSG